MTADGRRVQGPPARDRRPRGEGARGHRASQAEGVAGDALTLGEPGTDNDQRRAPFAEALADAGIGPRVVEDIRAQAWRKLMGNAVFNPLSVLTRATLAEIGRTSSTRSLAAALVEDVLAVALALGRTPPISIGGRVAGTERVGDHRTPMLQDLQAGKKLKLDPLTSAVIELARLCRRGRAEAPDAPRSN